MTGNSGLGSRRSINPAQFVNAVHRIVVDVAKRCVPFCSDSPLLLHFGETFCHANYKPGWPPNPQHSNRREDIKGFCLPKCCAMKANPNRPFPASNIVVMQAFPEIVIARPQIDLADSALIVSSPNRNRRSPTKKNEIYAPGLNQGVAVY